MMSTLCDDITPSPPAPPSPPETVQVQVVGPTTMTVSWSVDPQRANRDDITQFHVLCVESVSGAVVLNT